MHYLVTGGAGFIGSNIVEELLNRGEKVRVLDSFITGRRENLEGFLDKIELIEGDIRDERAADKATKGVDFVLHQAALRSVPKSVDNPTLTNDINVSGTLAMLIAAKNNNVKRFVYASSSSAYGETDQFPEREDACPNPISPYGVSKLTGEYYCRAFSATMGLETVSLRYFNVFGPRQDPESKYSAVIPAFISQMIKGFPPEVHGDGKQSRDFTYVSNVAEANLLAATAPVDPGDVFNVACNEEHRILDIVDALNAMLGSKIKPVFMPKRQGDVPRTLADISKLRKKLKYKIGMDFDKGLQKTFEWFKANPSRLKAR
ncbi:MAG: SDR family oxidoreductase [Candidatus Omnitrophica bacterium]|nr:SDR family oxidoreductase [Candidatus Omnitrophota bacterium]